MFCFLWTFRWKRVLHMKPFMITMNHGLLEHFLETYFRSFRRRKPLRAPLKTKNLKIIFELFAQTKRSNHDYRRKLFYFVRAWVGVDKMPYESASQFMKLNLFLGRYNRISFFVCYLLGAFFNVTDVSRVN